MDSRECFRHANLTLTTCQPLMFTVHQETWDIRLATMYKLLNEYNFTYSMIFRTGGWIQTSGFPSCLFDVGLRIHKYNIM